MHRHATSTLRFADVHLSTGVRLHYAEQGPSDGNPIILLHGYTDSWFSFSRVLPRLSARAHVYAPDQRGHGDSDRPESEYTMHELAADVIAFMDAMGLSQTTVVGHSMGSFVDQEIMFTDPERVARPVLVGSGTRVGGEEILQFKHAVDTLIDPVPAAFARDFQLSTIHHPVPNDFLDTAVPESLKLPARVWRSALAGQLAFDSAAQLGRIQVPTLIIQGDQDTVFIAAAQDALVAGLASAIVKIYPETDHALHWERPERFARDLENFVRTA